MAGQPQFPLPGDAEVAAVLNAPPTVPQCVGVAGRCSNPAEVGPLCRTCSDVALAADDRWEPAQQKARIRLLEKWRQEARADVATTLRNEKQEATAGPQILTLRERLALPRRPEEWRVQGLQQIGQRVTFSAQFKAGKTTTVGNLVRSLLDGDPFLDKHEVSPVQGKVGLVDFEMATDEPGQLDDWYRDLGIKDDDRLVVVPLRGRARAFDLTDDATLTKWAALLRGHGITYLVVDCLRPVLDAIGLDENHEAGLFLVKLDALLIAAGITECLLVHHMGHQNERSRGDSRILDWPDVLWTLVRESEDPASARYFKALGRGVEVTETRLEFNPSTKRLAAGEGSRKQVRGERVQETILRALGSGQWLNTRGVRDAVGGDSHDFTPALAALVREGKVETMSGPRNAKLYRLKTTEDAEV